MEILNRKAHFNYTIEDEFEAGLVLLGSEVKSLREGKANLSEAYISEVNGELFLTNCNISEYKGANRFNHPPKRLRKILLRGKEIEKILGKMQRQGYSLIPLRLFFNKRNFAKIIVALARGKKIYDKRETIKKRDDARRTARGEE